MFSFIPLPTTVLGALYPPWLVFFLPSLDNPSTPPAFVLRGQCFLRIDLVLGVVVHAYNPYTPGGGGSRVIEFEASLG